MPIRVVIADDQAEFRDLLRIRFALDGRITVSGEASDGAEALRVVTRERPDAVVIDLDMPKSGGLEVIPRIRDEVPHTKIVVLSNSVVLNEQTLAITRGADAFLSKSSELGWTIPTIVSLVQGDEPAWFD